MQCSHCGQTIKGRAVYFDEKYVCRTCLIAEANKGNRCPCCGADVGPNAGVGLLLARPGDASEEKASASTALVIVCPECHVLFVDGFQYKLMQSYLHREE